LQDVLDSGQTFSSWLKCYRSTGGGGTEISSWSTRWLCQHRSSSYIG